MSDTTFDARVIHPLDDAPEAKLYRPDLGLMKMTPTVRLSLILMRAYLAAMIVLVAFRVVVG